MCLSLSLSETHSIVDSAYGSDLQILDRGARDLEEKNWHVFIIQLISSTSPAHQLIVSSYIGQYSGNTGIWKFINDFLSYMFWKFINDVITYQL